MDIKRSYKTMTLANGAKKLIVEFSDPYYDILTSFFVADYSSFGDWIDNEIELVLSGKEEIRDITGNVYELVIEKDYTKVYDTLAEDAMGNWCRIATDDLVELIREWREMKKQLE